MKREVFSNRLRGLPVPFPDADDYVAALVQAKEKSLLEQVEGVAKETLDVGIGRC